jgi:hypothetical protein
MVGLLTEPFGELGSVLSQDRAYIMPFGKINPCKVESGFQRQLDTLLGETYDEGIIFVIEGSLNYLPPALRLFQ